MCPLTGRVYYPTIKKYGELALVSSKLAIELDKCFIFNKSDKDKDHQFDEPSAIKFNDKTYELSKALKQLLIKRNKRFV